MLLTAHMGSMSKDCRARMEIEAAASNQFFVSGRSTLKFPKRNISCDGDEEYEEFAVIGGSGFVGVELVRCIKRRGDNAKVLDIKPFPSDLAPAVFYQ